MGSAWELVRRRLIICGSDEPAFFRRARPLPEQQHVAAKMQPTSSKTPPTAAMAITAHNGSGGSGGGELGGGGEPATIATASLRGSAACAQRGEEKGATGKAAPRRERTNHATHLPRQQPRGSPERHDEQDGERCAGGRRGAGGTSAARVRRGGDDGHGTDDRVVHLRGPQRHQAEQPGQCSQARVARPGGALTLVFVFVPRLSRADTRWVCSVVSPRRRS